jgi:Tfp pilus assembly protein PilV
MRARKKGPCIWRALISRPRARDRRGASLIELVAAFFVLTLGLLGAVETFHFGTDKLKATRDAAIAERAVQNQVEALRAMPFAELKDCENAPFNAESELDFGRLVKAAPPLTIRSNADGLRMKEVAVAVQWVGENGRKFERKAATLIADKEAGQ